MCHLSWVTVDHLSSLPLEKARSPEWVPRSVGDGACPGEVNNALVARRTLGGRAESWRIENLLLLRDSEKR